MKKRKPIVLSEVKPEEMRKYEIAKELGLLDKVLAEGWQSLSAKETGKIGGMLSKAAKEAKAVKVMKGENTKIFTGSRTLFCVGYEI